MPKKQTVKRKSILLLSTKRMRIITFTIIFAAVGAAFLLKSFAATTNGKFIYQTSNGIFAQNADGTGLNQVTSNQSYYLPIIRHPNGQYVAYAYYDKISSTYQGKVVTIDGKTSTTFYTARACSNYYSDFFNHAAFRSTLDGTQPRLVFTFTTVKWRDAQCSTSYTPVSTQIMAIDADGSKPTIFVTKAGYEFSDVNWSVDGKIYFKRCNQTTFVCDLVVRETDGTRKVLISNLSTYVLSGDGTKILFNTADHPSAIYGINSDGTNKWTIFSNLGEKLYLQCAGYSGYYFAFKGSASSTYPYVNLYFAQSSGAGLKKLDYGLDFKGCVFSPQNDRILISKHVSNQATNNSSLYSIVPYNSTLKINYATPYFPSDTFDW